MRNRRNNEKTLGNLLSVLTVSALLTCSGGAMSETKIDTEYTAEETYFPAGKNVWENCEKNGSRKFILSDGAIFESEWSFETSWTNEGARGKAQLTLADGSVHRGDWKKCDVLSIRDDKGRTGSVIFSYVDVLEGKWENCDGKGKGRIIFSTGAVYDGEWENGKANGKGKLILQRENVTLDGTWKDGRLDGIVKLIVLDNIVVYDGEFRNGKAAGNGKFNVKGNILEGNFKAVSYPLGIVGKAIFTRADGIPVECEGDDCADLFEESIGGLIEEYYMEWERGRKSGSGKFILSDGAIFESVWGFEGDLKVKEAQLTLVDGSIHRGDWEKCNVLSVEGDEGKTGSVIFSYVDVLEGKWENCDGKGKGRIMFPTEAVYDGEWENGKANGKGKLIMQQKNSTFDGTWKNGRLDGTVKVTIPANAISYDGEFRNGKAAGEGKLNVKGNTLEGNFRMVRYPVEVVGKAIFSRTDGTLVECEGDDCADLFEESIGGLIEEYYMEWERG
ncbi:MAG: hypothetical protein LBB24_02100, partial [Rickettsiales bacterium]|nr:hypothetical protein [Rickettsiales bacterium]